MSIKLATEPREEHLLRVLSSGRTVTQRSLAKELGLALGLTNLLIRRLTAKGYVRMIGLRPRHVRYLVTSSGRRVLASATRASIRNTVNLYTETRDAIRAGLRAVEANLDAGPGGDRRVVFYGAGDVAEIAYVSLQSTRLTLAGIVDDHRTDRFFGFDVRPPAELVDPAGAISDAHVVVATIRRSADIRQRLTKLGVPPERVSYVGQLLAERDDIATSRL